MAEIEFLLPTVQYGNVKVRATPEELGLKDGVSDAAALGYAAAVYLNAFTQGFKYGALADVVVPDVASDDMTAAVTAVSELGATVVEQTDEPEDPSDNDLPWEGKVKAEPKPWEKKAGPSPVVAAPEKAPAKISW